MCGVYGGWLGSSCVTWFKGRGVRCRYLWCLVSLIVFVYDRFRFWVASIPGSLRGLVYDIPYVVHYWVRLLVKVCLGFNLPEFIFCR